MRLQLEGVYEELCVEYNTKPLSGFRACLHNTYACPDGEVFIDASSVEGDHFCVFSELLRHLLRRPNRFIQPTMVIAGNRSSPLDSVGMSMTVVAVEDHQVYYAVPPRLLRLKIQLSRNVNNADVERVTRLIAVEKKFGCLPFPLPPSDVKKASGNTTGSLSQLTWPEKAVVESLDLHDCVFVSLQGGRALRAATRRNLYLQNIFLEGSSVNAAVVQHIGQATRRNREAFLLAGTQL